MSNILIIKHGSLGDIAQASGAIQDISDNHPNDDLYILSTKPYHNLLKKNPNITDIWSDKNNNKPEEICNKSHKSIYLKCPNKSKNHPDYSIKVYNIKHKFKNLNKHKSTK